MVESQAFLTKTEDLKKAARLLDRLKKLLKITMNAFGLYKSGNKIKIYGEGPELKDAAAAVFAAISQAKTDFERAFHPEDRVAQKYLIGRGGSLIISAYMNLLDLYEYYKSISETGKLPTKPFWKVWGTHWSYLNDASSIRKPFIDLVQDVHEALTGSRPSDDNIIEEVKKIRTL